MYLNTKNEKIIYFNNQSSELAFHIYIAGITMPSSSFEIKHDGTWSQYVFGYVARGSGKITADGASYHLCSGDYYFINRNRIESTVADKKAPFERWFVTVSGRLVDMLCDCYSISETVIVKHNCAEAFGWFKKLFGLLENSTDSTFESDMNEASLMIHRMLTPFGKRIFQLGDEEQRSTAELIRLFIDTHVSYRTLSLEVLEKQFSLSRSQITRLFKSEFNETPVHYILGKRLETACYWLSATKMSVSEISARLQFNDTHTFLHAFKRAFGMPPSEWRERYKSKYLLKEQKNAAVKGTAAGAVGYGGAVPEEEWEGKEQE